MVFAIAAGAGIATLALVPQGAAASCASLPSLSTTALSAAPIAFVGTVTGLDSGGRVATVHVDDVWRGTGIGSVVTVVGTPDLAATATSVDRTYVSGQQYLFVPTGGSGTNFQDNQCTATEPYTPSLAGLRPSAAPGPPPATGGAAYMAAYVVLGVAALVTVGLGVVVYRRRMTAAHTPPR